MGAPRDGSWFRGGAGRGQRGDGPLHRPQLDHRGAGSPHEATGQDAAEDESDDRTDEEPLHRPPLAPRRSPGGASPNRPGTPSSPTIALSPSAGTPTRSFTVSGQGFPSNDRLDVFFDTADVGLLLSDLTGKTPALGLQVPTLASPGLHWVSVLDAGGVIAQAAFLVSAPWGQAGYQASRGGLNPFENLITPLNAGQLIKVARGITGGAIQSSPAKASGGGCSSAPTTATCIGSPRPPASTHRAHRRGRAPPAGP